MLPLQPHDTLSPKSDPATLQEIERLLAEAKNLRDRDSKSSIALIEQALSQIQTLPDYQTSTLYIESHIELAASFMAASLYQPALTAVLQAQAMLKHHSILDYTIRIQMILTSIHLVLGDFAEAFATLAVAQEAAQQKGDQAAQAEILSKMGQAALWIDDYPKAIEYFHQAMTFGEQHFLSAYDHGLLFNNLAYAYLVLEKPQEARLYAQRGLEITRHAQHAVGQLVLLGTLSEIALAEGDRAAAEAYIQQSQQLGEHAESVRLRLEHLRSLTTFSLQTGQIEAAITACEEALTLSKQLDAKLIILEQLRLLTRLHEQKGDLQQALQHAKAFKDSRQTVQRENSDNRRAVQIEAYHYEQVRQEHQSLKEKSALLEQLTEERQQALRIQQQLIDAILTIDTPILPLLPGVLTVPLVGVLDDQRMSHMHEQFLQYLGQHQSQIALLDITGVSVVDTFVASSLIHLVEGAQLMGCRVILVGIRPDIAQSLVGLGVSLDHITTFASLADGLRAALPYMGYRLQAIQAHR